MNYTQYNIPAVGVRSLTWVGNDLIDWVSGGDRYELGGAVIDAYIRYAYPFDAAIVSPSGEYAVLYTRTQTKGVLLRNGEEIVRQINRDYYQANVYEYPVSFARLRDGREVLIQCPEHYNVLVVEDVVTGEDLTARDYKDAADIFHSRLSVSPSGKWLIRAQHQRHDMHR